MQFLSFLWSPGAVLIWFNLLVFIFLSWFQKKQQVRLNIWLNLIIVDSVVLYGILSRNISADAPPFPLEWLIVIGVGSLLFYWGGMMIVSMFLLPVELNDWRKWRLTALTILCYMIGTNAPYFGYNPKTRKLEERFGGKNNAEPGGWGMIFLQPEHAVVVSKGIKITSVKGDDVVFTRRLERPDNLLDLALHVLVMFGVKAVTKDGINVKFNVFALGVIDPANSPTSSNRLYPFNSETISTVTRQQSVENGERTDWYQIVIQRAKKVAQDVTATVALDRMFEAEDAQTSPREQIRAQMQARLIGEMANSGIIIRFLGFANVEPDEPDPVDPKHPDAESIDISRKRVLTWQASWERQAARVQADSEAEAIRILEEARAQSLTELINAVNYGFRTATTTNPVQVINLSFINALEQILERKDMPPALTEEANPQLTLQELRRMIIAGQPGK